MTDDEMLAEMQSIVRRIDALRDELRAVGLRGVAESMSGLYSHANLVLGQLPAWHRRWEKRFAETEKSHPTDHQPEAATPEDPC